MASFEGLKWADNQMMWSLVDRELQMVDAHDKTYAVSKSIHYGICLVFEGIRFYCHEKDGVPHAVFGNWHRNLERFRRGIAFNLSNDQQELVPTVDELEDLFLRYLRQESLRPFIDDMVQTGAQGYLRPFTLDEVQSIGVTFPSNPAIRAIACHYDQYLGEPFTGVVVPHLVRAVSENGTGCLKLGINYLISIRAVAEAKKLVSDAAAALFLDDHPHLRLEERNITEWDSSCCLLALKDGTVIKIPESNLILPSVTIAGIVSMLRERGVNVVENDVTYGELRHMVEWDNLACICSVGTAGILNRCSKLHLVDGEGRIIATHEPDMEHELYGILGEMRDDYWNIFKGAKEPPEGIERTEYPLA